MAGRKKFEDGKYLYLDSFVIFRKDGGIYKLLKCLLVVTDDDDATSTLVAATTITATSTGLVLSSTPFLIVSFSPQTLVILMHAFLVWHCHFYGDRIMEGKSAFLVKLERIIREMEKWVKFFSIFSVRCLLPKSDIFQQCQHYQFKLGNEFHTRLWF